MVKVFRVLLLCVFILSGCSKNTPESSLPKNRETMPVAASTITPFPTLTSTPRSIRWGNQLIQFNDMAIISDDEVWAVGQNGLIIHDYLTFRALAGVYDYSGEYNFIHGYLDHVEFTSQDDGWMLSSCAQVFHWNGESWAEARPANLPDFPDDCRIQFSDVSFASKDDGWLIGTATLPDTDIHQAILYHWNGSDWKKVSIQDNIGRGDFAMVDIDVVSAQEIWIVGNNFKDYQAVILHWNGKHWKEVPTIEKMTRLKSISATGTNDVWTTNGAEIFHWDGNAWEIAKQMKAHYSRSDFGDLTIKAVNPENVWIGSYDQLAHWDGKTWQDVQGDETLDIVDIETSPNGKVWALTRTGSIFGLVK